MKRTLLFMTLVATASLMNSCVLKECESDNTGKVMVINSNPFEINVDVMNSEHIITNEIRTLAPNESTTYTLTAGLEATVQVKLGSSWSNVKRINVIQCETQEYSFEYCNYNGNNYAKEVKVINNTGKTMVVDIYSVTSGRFIEELTISNGITAHYYSVPAGDFRVWGKYSGGSWFVSNTYNVSKCGKFEFTWTAKSEMITPKEVKETSNIGQFDGFGDPSIKK